MKSFLIVFFMFSTIIGYSAETYVIMTGTVVIDQSYVDQYKVKHEKFVTHKYYTSSMEIDLEVYPKEVVEEAFSSSIDKKHKEKKKTTVSFQSFTTKEAARDFHTQLIKDKEGIRLNLPLVELKKAKEAKEKK